MTFVVLFAISAAFVGVGMLIAFWPAAYLRWVRWSKVESYAPQLVRGLDFNLGTYDWRSRIVGIGLALFGIAAATLTSYIKWLQ